ncbi:FAD-dependent monooxygenase [Actinosynnema sp. NPDC020468]|uniref:FAD-dependent monooxygenase n=1 Tax=Actinosynnema sp. NPDC020468 TaxID=3154488 RepID=UPI0033DEF2FE
MAPHVLVSGASIAGPALAFWLRRNGFTTTVVERAPALRPGGQTVDLRGAGLTVVERMGLADEARARTTGELGVRFVDRSGRTKAAFGTDSLEGKGFVVDVELLRGELAGLLHDHTSADTEYVFGDEITAVRDGDGHVDVVFRHGPDRRFDLVVLADGLRSRTRGLVFGDRARYREFGLCTAYFTIPYEESDERWAWWYNAPGGRTVVLRPDNVGTTRASLSFRGTGPSTVEEQKSFLRGHYADAGWHTPRVLAGLDRSPDFYFESVAQVRVDRWSEGRVALLGDAAHCASPLSGMGTSLALVGAYVLAGELARHADHRDAFAAYEATMRPYVAKAQRVSSLAPRLAAPSSALGIRALHAALGLASSPVATRLASRFANPPADAIELPEFAASR